MVGLPQHYWAMTGSFALSVPLLPYTSLRDLLCIRVGAALSNLQELDSEYLIIWDGFDGKPWAYRDASGTCHAVKHLESSVQDCEVCRPFCKNLADAEVSPEQACESFYWSASPKVIAFR